MKALESALQEQDRSDTLAEYTSELLRVIAIQSRKCDIPSFRSLTKPEETKSGMDVLDYIINQATGGGEAK